MVFFRMESGNQSVASCFGYLAGMVQGLSPARFASEAYAAVYNGFYANGIMVAGYYAFAVLTLALALFLDWRRCFGFKNKPAETMLAAVPGWRRQVLYLALVACILVGYILQNGGFGGAAGLGMYAGY